MTRIDATLLDLRTALPFGTARGSGSEFDNLVVEIDDEEGSIGIGEAAPNRLYGETRDADIAALDELAAPLALVDGPAAIEAFCGAQDGFPALRAALSAAAWDLAGKRAGEPVWSLLGLARPTARTSLTIPVGDPETMVAQARAATGFRTLKVKLGFDGDVELVERLARERPDARLRCDVNEGWDRERAARALERLVKLGVESVEQPLPADDLDGQAWLMDRAGVQLFGDEALLDASLLDDVADLYDGFVVKLQKTGGIAAAASLIALCRQRALRVLLGCMVESSLGVAAALQVAGGVDYVDLDSPLLLDHDPYEGVTIEGDTLTASDEPGLGVRPRAKD